MQDEFEQRLTRMGNPDYTSQPAVARVLGVAEMTLWRWGRAYPEDMPEWQRAGGMKFLNAYQCLTWCREFAAKHPDLMERRKLPEAMQ